MQEKLIVDCLTNETQIVMAVEEVSEVNLAYFIDIKTAEIKQLLLESNETQLVDAPITYDKKLEWREYRKVLRELLTDPVFPNVAIPDKPE